MRIKYFFLTTLSCVLLGKLYTQVIVSFAVIDTVHPISLKFTNGITSDSVFFCNCTQGRFLVPDVNYCPTLTLNTRSEKYGNDFLYISLDKPVIQFSVSLQDSCLPVLKFNSDTFNQSYYEYANNLRPVKLHQRQLNKAMRDTAQNVDSLYTIWKQTNSKFSNIQYAFYTQHGHQSRARLLFAYYQLASNSMSKDSIRVVFDGMSGFANNMKQYDYCMKMLNDSSYRLEKGDKLPEMIFVSSTGNQWKTSNLNTGKVNYFFWATWCHGCKSELATLQKSKSLANWVVVNMDKDFDRWKSYLNGNDYLSNAYHYRSEDTDETLFRIGVNYLPYIIEVDDGVIVNKGAHIDEVLK